jgi:hypothetical protein
MRVVAHIQRSVLGLIFILTGLNGFFRFLHQPSFQTPDARELMTVMQANPYGTCSSAFRSFAASCC